MSAAEELCWRSFVKNLIKVAQKPGGTGGAMDRVIARLAFMMVCGMLLVAGCSAKEPVKIGFIGGMSGRVADLGVAGRNGAVLAIEQKNAAGGINGRKLELLVRDDEQKPEVAGKVVAELLAQKVELIIGPMTSSMAFAILPQIEASQTILLSPTVTSSALSGKDDHFLRVCGNTRDYAEKSADFQYRQQNRRTVAAVYDLNNREYSEMWMNEFRARFEKNGGRMQKAVGFHSGASTVFQELVRDLLSEKPDLALVIANSVDAGLIVQQIRKLAPKQAIALSEWPSTERFIELAGGAAEGAFVSQFFDRNNNKPGYQQFRTAYRKRFGGQEPGFAALSGHDAAMAAIEALEKRTAGEPLKQALLRIGRFSGAQQEFVIDRFGDAVRPTFIAVVRNGSYHTLEH